MSDRCILVVLPLLILALVGCTPAVLEPGPALGSTYVLDAAIDPPPERKPGRLVLVVALPEAEPGFDSRRIAYTRTPLALDYYTKSEWADTPGRMIAPLLVRALEQSGGLAAVVAAPTPVAGDVTLGLDVIRLQQEFFQQPSQSRLTLRAKLYDNSSRDVLATKLFETVEPAPSENAYGGVLAANAALKRLLGDITDWVLANLPRRRR